MENERIMVVRLEFTRSKALFFLTAFFICWRPGFLGSEQLTLTTYYPAPYGGYASLLTTGQTLLARDGGNVGVGTPAPAAKLDVAGQVKITGGSPGAGKVLTSDASGLASWQTIPGTPSGAVMVFNLASCPAGWTELISARGRYTVGLPLGGTPGATVGAALSNTENRPTGNHTHALSMGFPSTGAFSPYPAMAWANQSYAGVTGGTAYPAGTNAPYIQLLTCQKM